MAAHFREAFLLSLWFKSSSSLTLRFAKCRYQRGKALGYLDRAKRCGLSLCLSGCYSAPNTTDYVASSPCNERDLTLMQVLFSWTLFPREREKKWHLGTRSKPGLFLFIVDASSSKKNQVSRPVRRAEERTTDALPPPPPRQSAWKYGITGRCQFFLNRSFLVHHPVTICSFYELLTFVLLLILSLTHGVIFIIFVLF